MIYLNDVTANFGSFKLININLDVRKSEYYVILGPTGAGKTLLLELIAGFYKHYKGELHINGNNMKKIPSSDRKIGFVYQDYSLFPHMDVESNISFGLEMQRVKRSERNQKTHEMMKQFKIFHLKDRYPHTLSGGEQQKVALARALIIKPEILLLDEPFSALDPVTKKEAMKIVKTIHEDNELTTIEVTHNQNEAMLGDRISLIMNGAIVETGTPQAVFNAPKTVQTANFVGIENIIEGEIINNQDGYAEVQTQYFNVHCLSDITSGKVTLFIRPENIILSKMLFKSSIRNNIKTEVKDIFTISKELIQITMQNDLKAYITFNAKEDLDLKVGDEIYASFKATSISLKQ